jgi:Cof subfamily protein (haloacid dehalogenase superfamily)
MLNLPKPGNIKALAFDLDGTILAPGAVLSERTIAVVNKCVKRGVKIIIATGRAIEATERFRASLGADGPMVYYNGAVIAEFSAKIPAKMPESRIIKTTLLDKKKAEICVDISREMGVYCQIYLFNEKRIPLLAERDRPEKEMYYKHTGILADLVDLKEAIGRTEVPGCVKIMFLAEPEIFSKLRPRLDELLGDSIYITQSHRTFLEVMDAKVSKGQGLSFVMERLSLKREEVIAFGDEENDIPMFASAGFSVAPSNAKDTVKAKVDLVIGSNADDGVAIFLEEFFKL